MVNSVYMKTIETSRSTIVYSYSATCIFRRSIIRSK